MKTRILILVLTLINFFVKAQNETKHWCFGGYNHLLIDTTSVQVLTFSGIQTGEAASSISDINGNLLFYTNGETVWNKLDQVMQNGNGLNGDVSTTQCLIVKQPMSDSLYYIFYAGAAGSGGANYAIVDVSLNSGLGAVISKNNLLFTHSSEKFSAIKNINDTDIWVMTRTLNPTFFKSYLLTINGINNTPVISNVGVREWTGVGQMKFSHNGQRLALANNDSSCFELFDFNNSTGIVSNPHMSSYFTTIGVIGGLTYGIEFSPNDSILYCTLNFPPAILKYDLTVSGNPLFNYTVLDTSGCFSLGALQLAIDGNIYVAMMDPTANTEYLGILRLPNSWSNVNYVDSGLALNSYCNWSLPNFEQTLLKNVPSQTSSSINSMMNRNNFVIYPNPFINEISISIQNQNLKHTLFTIKNILGQTVFRKQENNISNTHTKTIDLSFLSKGIYLLEINIDGEQTVKKIVKE